MKNLFVADAAPFVSNPDKNPTLTHHGAVVENVRVSARPGQERRALERRLWLLIWFHDAAVLKSLSMGAVAGSVLRVIPLEAAEYAHQLIEAEKADAKAGTYVPKFFDAHRYKTLQALCETILPADADSGGAIEAGAPEFIDLLTSENHGIPVETGRRVEVARLHVREPLRQGLSRLRAATAERDSRSHCVSQECGAGRRPESAVEFFSLLRNLTADGFFTSKIGIKYLGYKGNTFLPEFPGCPPVPGV